MNRVKNRPALAQQPDVYLEPKWLRYFSQLPALAKKEKRSTRELQKSQAVAVHCFACSWGLVLTRGLQNSMQEGGFEPAQK